MSQAREYTLTSRQLDQRFSAFLKMGGDRDGRTRNFREMVRGLMDRAQEVIPRLPVVEYNDGAGFVYILPPALSVTVSLSYDSRGRAFVRHGVMAAAGGSHRIVVPVNGHCTRAKANIREDFCGGFNLSSPQTITNGLGSWVNEDPFAFVGDSDDAPSDPVDEDPFAFVGDSDDARLVSAIPALAACRNAVGRPNGLLIAPAGDSPAEEFAAAFAAMRMCLDRPAAFLIKGNKSVALGTGDTGNHGISMSGAYMVGPLAERPSNIMSVSHPFPNPNSGRDIFSIVLPAPRRHQASIGAEQNVRREFTRGPYQSMMDAIPRHYYTSGWSLA